MNIQTMQDVSKTMTSEQIAMLVDSRHDSVKRTIEMLMRKGVISQSHPVDGIKAANGVIPTHYVFSGEQGRLDSIVVVAQLCPAFTGELVKRWDELEKQVATIELPDFTNPALAARAWADEVEAKMIAQEQLAIAAPKTAMYDAIIESDHLLTISDVAKHLGLSPQALNSWLIDQGVYDKRRLPQKIFKTAFIDSGFGEMKLTDGGHTQPKITQLGQSWIVHNFNKWS